MEYALGISLDLPAPVKREIISAIHAARTTKRGTPIYEPHVSLYLCRFSRVAFPTLLKKIRKLHLVPLALHIRELHIDQSRHTGFISLRIRRTPSIVRLHETILHIANPLRGKLIRSKDLDRIPRGVFTRAEIARLKRYGYQRVLRWYSPHITLGEYGTDATRRRACHIYRQQLGSLIGARLQPPAITVGLYRYSPTLDRYVGIPQEVIIPLTH